MEKTADAVVIGGGIMGASTAHFLAKKGLGNVVLLEKRTLAGVSTGSSAGGIRTFYSNPLPIRLTMRALEMFENDREELGGDCGFQQVGMMSVLDEDNVEAGLSVLRGEIEENTGSRELTLDEARELAPQLNFEDIVSVTYQARAGYADPVKTTRSLADSAASKWGLAVHEGVGATGIRMDGDRVVGVETEEGFIETRVAVNAAGPWGREVGVWVGTNDSIRWSRETDVVLRLPEDFGRFPVVGDPNLRFYFRPDGDDKVMAGLGFPKEIEPLDIDDYDQHLDADTRGRITERLFQRVPSLRDAEYDHGWGSIYTITDDWHPIVGAEPGIDGYYACYAGSGHGFKLGPPLGEALADVIAGDTPKIDIGPLRGSRFREGDVFSSAWVAGNRA